MSRSLSRRSRADRGVPAASTFRAEQGAARAGRDVRDRAKAGLSLRCWIALQAEACSPGFKAGPDFYCFVKGVLSWIPGTTLDHVRNTQDKMVQTDPSPRLELRPIPWEAVDAIAHHQRLDDWASDFPDGGDVVIAGLLRRRGPEQLAPVWGHHQIVERGSGLVVGGVGFFGPPEQGRAEIGYGVVPSRQGRGYATEAVGMLTSVGWVHGALEITAKTDLDNRASQRVLEKTGFQLLGEDELRIYGLRRPR